MELSEELADRDHSIILSLRRSALLAEKDSWSTARTVELGFAIARKRKRSESTIALSRLQDPRRK
jgi:hypothetical protein